MSSKTRIIFITNKVLSESLKLEFSQLPDNIYHHLVKVEASTNEQLNTDYVFLNMFRGCTHETLVFIDSRHPLADEIHEVVLANNVYVGKKYIKSVIVIGANNTTITELMDWFAKQQETETKVAPVQTPAGFITGLILTNDASYQPGCEGLAICQCESIDDIAQWFDSLIMNLTAGDVNLSNLKAVMYHFPFGEATDEEIRDLILRVVPLFTAGKEFLIFNETQEEEFKNAITPTAEDQAALEEYIKRHQASVKAIPVNVDDAWLDAALKPVIEKMKETLINAATIPVVHQPIEPKSKEALFNYGQAIEMCKDGIDVACVNWRADTFLTVNYGAYVHADDFWSPGNKRAAMSRPDKSMSVFPHFLRTDSFGTVPHMVDFNDQFSEWVVASDRVKVKNVKIDKTDGLDKLVLEFGLDTFSTPDFELAPFWIVYDVLAKHPSQVTVISYNPDSLLPHIVGSMKEAHDSRRNLVEESFDIVESRIEEDSYKYRGVDFICNMSRDKILDKIKAGEITNVILDDDTFKAQLSLDNLKAALQEANVNWVTVSVKEQLFGISE